MCPDGPVSTEAAAESFCEAAQLRLDTDTCVRNYMNNWWTVRQLVLECCAGPWSPPAPCDKVQLICTFLCNGNDDCISDCEANLGFR